MKLLAAVSRFQDKLEPADSFPYPNVGRVKFYVLTFSGPLVADADESELEAKRHELSDLFYLGHEVLSELRRSHPD